MEIIDQIIETKSTLIPEFNLKKEYLETLYFVYPFNRFEYAISHLLARNIMSLEEYQEMHDNYHSRNKYLHLFQITAPRKFGTWAENHITELVPELVHPNRALDPNYKGEYDLYYDGIKIEIKASRAVNSQQDSPLIEKALFSGSTSSFNMNFQQLKPSCCDVFIWIGVWRDIIRYWVLSSDDVMQNKNFSKGQHRGNEGEGQLWITNENISEFDSYITTARDMLSIIKQKKRMVSKAN